jgi:hypothetical protein
MAEWTDAELRSTIRAYLEMLSAQDRGVAYSKAAIRRGLQNGPLKARSESSIEYRMRNITAVLENHGRRGVKGYIAAQNVGDAVSAKIWGMVREIDADPPRAPASPTTAAQTPARSSHSRERRSSRRPPIIYFNIGWMKNYAGAASNDVTIGAHGYLDDHLHGAESFNFVPTENGTVRGYRPPGDREQTNITRMGAASADTEIGDALVVWLAREPGSGRTLIVGWYQNASVFRTARDGGTELNGEPIHYTAEARTEDAILLPPIARTFEVQSSRVLPGAGFGQKPTWFGSEAVDARVWAYVQSKARHRGPKNPAGNKTPPKNLDPELRRKVEKAAIEHAIAYYKSEFGDSCPIVSVETAAKGWDLEVYNGPEPILVEVKGLMNVGLVCELTPNEYEKMMLPAHSSRYVVYVVNNALAAPPATPVASIFEHVRGREWRTADGRELIIEEKTAAVLSCP